MARKTLTDILVEAGTITDAQARAFEEEAGGRNRDIEQVLLGAGIPEKDVYEAKAEFLGVPFYDLAGRKVPFDVLRNISEESAGHYQFVPLALEGGALSVGMVRPEDMEAREALKFISANVGAPFKVYLLAPSEFKAVLEQYKGIGGEVGKALGELEDQIQKETVPAEYAVGGDTVRPLVEDTPVTKIVAVILKHATEGSASDIHIEPVRDHLQVRFRLDGILYTSLLLPVSVHDAVVSRIKILTNLKLDEKRKPQDGRFSAHVEGRNIDFRVSTFPTYFGEKVVIRILDSTASVRDLPTLGLEGRNLSLVENAIKRPYGMILVTGPTGSGKSTTLYALLQLLNRERSNVISLEDPVEYSIAGVNQSQVRPEIGYDFASGLRSVLRQDPDIIMVGEIRDKETAQLAIHAALTGHLVFSTLHTNDATGVIPRLIDMGVDPFLIPATLVLAVGQRLVRTLCKDSRKELALEGRLKEMVEKEAAHMPSALREGLVVPHVIYQALPSATCPKGTRGRIGIFETLAMTPELEQLILHEPSEANIIEEARRQGMITMRQDGMLKVLRGVIGMEELTEVAI